MRSFASDYQCMPHPAVMKAVMKSCAAKTNKSYGEDTITREAVDLIGEHFGGDVGVCFVTNGTAANRLALQTVLPHPYSAVICSDTAHINTAEGGAIESLGHKLLTTPAGCAAKLDLDVISSQLAGKRDIHLAYPEVVSISNATDAGTVYSFDELSYIGRFAKQHKLMLHVDGARLSNAAAHISVNNLATVSLSVGADVITFGGTKNGGMMGEAVIFRDPEFSEIALRLQKQQGQLCARIHCVAAQFIALLTDDLWFKNACNANEMATILADRCQKKLGLTLMYPVESNAVFVSLPQKTISKLQQETDFYVFGTNTVRWMCSWDTTEEDVEALITLIEKNLK